ncbi:MAG: accessory factor UbiK family protein [Alphaproteobacteria bacterium]|nr:accessory factor UbiK family protein [Alphaproteobacteria bacterium]
MQKDSKLFDDLARLASGAAGGFADITRELQGMVHTWVEKRLAAMKLVTREEFETVRLMAANAREENEKLAERIRKLENNLK